LTGRISLKEYLHKNSLADWTDRVGGGEFLKRIMKPQDKLYVWDTTPVIYLVSGKHEPDPRFTYNQNLTADKFLLDSEKDTFPRDDIKMKNRSALIGGLLADAPEYIALRFEPEYAIPQMLGFPQLTPDAGDW